MFCVVCIVILLAPFAYVLYNLLGRKTLLENITKRAVFITGCDSGFGAALARRLDALGVPVFAGCLTEDGSTQLQKDTSSRLRVVIMDVRSTESIQAGYDTVRASLQPGEELWAVVNNAGISSAGGPLEFLSRQDFTSVFEVNVFGMAEVCRIFLPLLKRSKGRIVNMTSIAGVQASPVDIAYSASKYAAEGLSDGLRRTLYVWGISVHIIEPSFFKTPIADKGRFLGTRRDQWENLPAELKEEYGDDFLGKSLEYASKLLNSADPAIELVIDAYQHALLAKHPMQRYQVGGAAKLLHFLMFFPPIVIDFIIKWSDPLPLPKSVLKRE